MRETDDRETEREVRAAARAGARSVTRRRQVVADAVEEASYQWLLRNYAGGADVRSPRSWAFAVGANTAKRLAKGPGESGRRDPTVDSLETLAATRAAEIRARLASGLEACRPLLTRKQFEVVQVLARSGSSLHRAARMLGMDRSGLRRVFQRALMRLTLAQKRPPPHSSG